MYAFACSHEHQFAGKKSTYSKGGIVESKLNHKSSKIKEYILSAMKIDFLLL